MIFFFVFLFGQMLGCRNRGFSFTRALLGISADELHLCGDAAAIPLIQKMLKVTSDEVEVISYCVMEIGQVVSAISLYRNRGIMIHNFVLLVQKFNHSTKIFIVIYWVG